MREYRRLEEGQLQGERPMARKPNAEDAAPSYVSIRLAELGEERIRREDSRGAFVAFMGARYGDTRDVDNENKWGHKGMGQALSGWMGTMNHQAIPDEALRTACGEAWDLMDEYRTRDKAGTLVDDEL